MDALPKASSPSRSLVHSAEGRADRSGRRVETAPLSAPITAAFIGLLLLRQASWVEEAAASPDLAADGAPGADLPDDAESAAPPAGRNMLVGTGAVVELTGAAVDGSAAPTPGPPPGAGARGASDPAVDEVAVAAPGRASLDQGGGSVALAGLQIDANSTVSLLDLAELDAEITPDEQPRGLGLFAHLDREIPGATDGDDVLVGDERNDYASGGAGDDRIEGHGGDDMLYGDAGDDVLLGGDGNDVLHGGEGDDRLEGGAGSDQLHGGPGNDVLAGGAGTNTLLGGTGNDRFVLADAEDALDIIHDDAGANVVEIGWVTSDALRLVVSGDVHGTGATSLVGLVNGAERFVVADYDPSQPAFSVQTADGTFALPQARFVQVDGYANHVVGSDGADRLWGFGGADLLDGGAGADTYVIDLVRGGVDTIRDGDTEVDAISTVTLAGVEMAQITAALVDGTLEVSVDGAVAFKIADFEASAPLFRLDLDDGVHRLPGVNHAPTVTSQPADRSVDERTVQTFALPEGLFADVDPGETLTLAATRADGTALPDWIQFDADTGRFTVAPTNDVIGAFDIKVTATDSFGASVAASFVVDVVNVNDAPEAQLTWLQHKATEDAAFVWTLPDGLFTDPDPGDVLTITVESGTLPPWLAFDAATGTFSGTPANEDVGSVDIRLVATDRAGAQATATLTLVVENTNDAPTVGVIPPAEQIQRLVGDGTTYSYTLPAGLFRDADEGDVLSFKAVMADGSPLPDWLSFDGATGRFEAIPPDLNVDPFTVRIVAADRAGATAEATLRFDVSAYNRAPTLVGDTPDALVAAAHRPFAWTPADDTFADEDGDLLSYRLERTDGGALPDWLVFDAATGAISGTPGDGDAATLGLRLVAVDPSGAEVGFDFGLEVRPNAAPVATAALDPWVVTEDQAGQLMALPDDLFTDADGDSLTLSVTLADGSPLEASFLSFDPATRQLFAAPDHADDGPVTVRITATDVHGASTSVLMDIEVTPVNDAPELTLAPGEELTPLLAVEGEGYSWQLPRGLFVDEEGEAITLSARLADGTALPDWLSFHAPTSTFHGTAGDDALPVYRIEVTATDASGAATTTAFDLYVEGVNAAPTVEDTIALQTARQDVAFAFALPAGLFVDPDGDLLTIDASLGGGAALPDWLTFENGIFRGTPGNADVGSIDIWITARDPAGREAATAFRLEVENVNDRPQARDAYYKDPVVVKEGRTTVLDLSPEAPATDQHPPKVHFFDIDGDLLTLVVETADGAALPSWLVFDPHTFALSITPDAAAAAAGTITLVISARDPSGASSGATTIDLAVEPLADLLDTPLPVWAATQDVPMVALALEGRFTEAPGAVLEATLADGSALPSWLAFDAATGTFTGTPDNDGVGKITVVVRASDAAGHVDVESFELHIANVNDAPTVTGSVDAVTVAEGDIVSIALPDDLFADVDIPHGDALTLSAPGLPHWLFLDAASGTIQGIAADVASDRTYTLTIRATDGGGAIAEVDVSLTVTAANEAPEVALSPAPAPATEGQAYSWVLPEGTFDDPDGDPLTFQATLADGSPLPAWLSFDAATRTFSGTPGDLDPGILRLRVTATDPGGLQAETTLTLRVSNVNDRPVAVDAPDDQAVDAGTAIAPLAVAAFFDDVDLAFGDRLAYTARLADGSALPAGLVFDGTTLSGSPTEAGSYEIEIVARDMAGLEATQVFRLEVQPASAAPDYTLRADGALPEAALPPASQRWDEGFYSSDRFYKLSDGPIPDEYRDVLAGAGRPVSLPHDHIRLNPTTPERYTRAVLGDDEDNIIFGGGTDDILIGQGGNDILSGGDGDDVLYGGEGDDVLAGGRGSDRLEGGAGADRYEIGGLQDGAVDSIYDTEGANTVDFDGVGADRMSFGMDGADLVVAVDGVDAVRIEGFASGEATFDILADDASVSHEALVAAIEEMRAAYGAGGDGVPLVDVLDGWLGPQAASAPVDPVAAFVAGGDAPELEVAVPAPAAEEVAAFTLPAGADTHDAATAGLASKAAEEEQPTYA